VPKTLKFSILLVKKYPHPRLALSIDSKNIKAATKKINDDNE